MQEMVAEILLLSLSSFPLFSAFFLTGSAFIHEYEILWSYSPCFRLPPSAGSPTPSSPAAHLCHSFFLGLDSAYERKHAIEVWLRWFFFFFGGIGVWTQNLILSRQVFYHLSHSPSPLLTSLTVPFPHSNIHSHRHTHMHTHTPSSPSLFYP
jgi:hypothetical protein